MVNNVFIEAPIKTFPPDDDPGRPFPDTSVPVRDCVIVGLAPVTPDAYIWHIVTEDQAKVTALSIPPEFRGETYTQMRAEFATTADTTLEALVDDGGEIKRVKMDAIPGGATVLESDVPPHFFAGVDAS